MNVKLKKVKISSRFEKRIFFAGVLVYVLSNTYFGWNAEAQSGAEKVWDVIWNILVYGGVFWWLVNCMVESALNSIEEISITK